MGRKAVDETGNQYGRLTVIERDHSAGPRRAKWTCACSCGTIRSFEGKRLRSGTAASCGCASADHLRAMNTVDGRTSHPLYGTWSNIRHRVLNPGSKDYPNYGGRGVGMSAEWVEDPFAFYSWIEGNLGPRPDGHSLDRIDNDGSYVPGNLRWADRTTQLLNQRPRVRNSELELALARIAELEAMLGMVD